MFAAKIDMSKDTRAFLAEHAGLFEPLALESSWYVETVVSYLEAEGAEPSLGTERLVAFAAALREHASDLRMSETAAMADKRAAGKVPNAAFWKYAERIDGYLAEIGFSLAPLFSPVIAGATSGAEAEAASAALATLLSHAGVSIRREMRIRPAWQHELVLKGVEGIHLAFARPIDAVVFTSVFPDLQCDGPEDMIRVLLRHYAGLPEPLGLSADETCACASTRIALARIGLMPAKAETPETLVRMLSEASRQALLHIARSLNGWLDEEQGRWPLTERFPVRLPMSASVSGDLVELGILERAGKRLRLTRAGAEACQVLATQNLRAA